MLKNFITLLMISIVGLNAHAENWVYVDENIYVDTKSREKKGDLATMNFKFKGGLSYIEVDCKNKIYLKPALKAEDRVDKDSIFGIMLNIACVKWYEVWK